MPAVRMVDVLFFLRTKYVYIFPSASSSWGYYEWSTLKPCFILFYGKHNFYYWLYWRRLHQTISGRCHTLSCNACDFLALASIRCMTATTSFIARSCVFPSLFTTNYYTHVVLFLFLILWLLHLPLCMRRLQVWFKAARLSGPGTKQTCSPSLMSFFRPCFCVNTTRYVIFTPI